MALNLTHTSTLYITENSLISKALELLLLKKEVVVRISYEDVPAPDATAPAFVHNNFLVFGPMNTLEFLIEFFPEPRTFPNDPTSRAIHRMLFTAIIDQLYPLCNTPAELIPKLNELESGLQDTNYFLNNNIYAVDCLLAPLLSRALGYTGLSPRLVRYATRLDAFFWERKQAHKQAYKQLKVDNPSWT